MKQVTLMDLLDSSIFNTNSLAPTLYLSESDENYLNRENKDKVFSLVKMSEKKKQLKLSSLFKIFSNAKFTILHMFLKKLLNGAEANCSLSAKMITEMSFFQLN